MVDQGGEVGQLGLESLVPFNIYTLSPIGSSSACWNVITEIQVKGEERTRVKFPVLIEYP